MYPAVLSGILLSSAGNATDLIVDAATGEIDATEVAENVKNGVVQEWFQAQIPGLLGFFWSVVIALIIWAIGVKLSGFFRKMMVKAMKRHDADTGFIQFMDSFVKYVVYVVLAIIILNIFGVTTTSAAAAVASLGVTAGLALQGSLSNFAGGILILALHPFRVGDYIVEDTHGNEGTVSEISIFYTKLKTLDNKIIVVPNGVLANSSMTNVTTSDKRMMDLTISIGYGDDIKKAKELLEDIINDEERRLLAEPKNVFVKELASSSVDLGMRFWVKTEDYWAVRWDTLEKVKYTLDENGVTIPFNQLDVHVQQ